MLMVGSTTMCVKSTSGRKSCGRHARNSAFDICEGEKISRSTSPKETDLNGVREEHIVVCRAVRDEERTRELRRVRRHITARTNAHESCANYVVLTRQRNRPCSRLAGPRIVPCSACRTAPQRS